MQLNEGYEWATKSTELHPDGSVALQVYVLLDSDGNEVGWKVEMSPLMADALRELEAAT